MKSRLGSNDPLFITTSRTLTILDLKEKATSHSKFDKMEAMMVHTSMRIIPQS